MMTIEALWGWLVYSACFSSVILIAAALTLRLVAAPADRLRLIVWALVACLIAPWLPGISGWKLIQLPLFAIRLPTTVTSNVAAWDHSSDEPTTAADAPDAISRLPGTIGIPAQQGDIGESLTEIDKTTQPRSVRVLRPANNTTDESQAVRSNAVSVAPKSSDRAAASFMSPTSWIVAVYLMAMAIQILWWCVGLWQRLKLERMALVAGNDLRAVFDQISTSGTRNVRLLVSDQVQTPLTWGLFRPVIVVPEKLATDSENLQLRWSLAHELSHVERRDVAALFLTKVVQVVCCYQPLAWWLGRQLVLCQDFIADARAANQAGEAEDYASFLVALAKERVRQTLPVTLGIGDRPSRLFRRVRMLLDATDPVSSQCTQRAACLSAVGVIFLLGALSTVRLVAEDNSRPEPVQKSQETSNASQNGDQKLSDPAQPVDLNSLENGVITGVLVSGPESRPVVDAEVWLRTWPVTQQTRTDTSGRFRIEKVPGVGLHGLQARKGNLTSQAQFSALPNADPKIAKFAPLRLDLVEGKSAKVVVTSHATGKPVPGARVQFFLDNRTAVTDAQGAVVIQGLNPDKQILLVDAESLAVNKQLVDLAIAGPMTEINIALEPGGSVRGVIVDGAGKPVPNASASAWSSTDTWPGNNEARTDAEGRFQIHSLALGRPVRISVRRKGFVGSEHELQLTSAKPIHDLHVALTPATPNSEHKNGSLTGLVVDRQKSPVGDVAVEFYDDHYQLQQQTTTGVDGKFDLQHLPTSKAKSFLRVRAKGFADLTMEVQSGTPEVPGTVNVRLEPSRALRVKVVTEDGKSVKGAYLEVTRHSAVYLPTSRDHLKADDSGEFTLESLPAEVTIAATLPGYHRADVTVSTRTQTEPVTLKLQRSGIIRGRVTDADSGNSIPQFKVSLKWFSDVQQPPGFWGLVGTGNDWWTRGETFVSQQEFVLGQCFPGMIVDLFVDAPGYDRLMVSKVVAKRPEDAQAIEVRLKKRDPATLTILAGQLVDHAGQPLPGVALRLVTSLKQPVGPVDFPYFWGRVRNGEILHDAPCEEYRSATTNATGHFEFKELRPDLYLQLVYWGQGAPIGRWVAANMIGEGQTENIVIRVPQPAKVIGRIDRTRFPHVSSIRAIVNSEQYPYSNVSLNEGQESFELDALPPGAYRVEVESRVGSINTEPNQKVLRRPVLARRLLTVEAGKSYDLQFLELDPLEPGQTRLSTEKDKVTIEGAFEVGSELVLMIGQDQDKLTWTSSSMKAGLFTAIVERSDEIKLDGGKLGSGIIFRTDEGLGKSQSNIHIPETGPAPSGQVVLRENGDYYQKDGRTTFADLQQSDGKRIPISVFIRKSN